MNHISDPKTYAKCNALTHPLNNCYCLSTAERAFSTIWFLNNLVQAS